MCLLYKCNLGGGGNDWKSLHNFYLLQRMYRKSIFREISSYTVSANNWFFKWQRISRLKINDLYRFLWSVYTISVDTFYLSVCVHVYCVDNYPSLHIFFTIFVFVQIVWWLREFKWRQILKDKYLDGLIATRIGDIRLVCNCQVLVSDSSPLCYPLSRFFSAHPFVVTISPLRTVNSKKVRKLLFYISDYYRTVNYIVLFTSSFFVFNLISL